MGLAAQFVPIKLSCSRVILDLSVGVGAVMRPEELSRVGVATQLHLPQLKPSPVGIQVGAAHEGQVNTQIAVHSRAIDANKDAIGDGGPSWCFGRAVEAGLWRWGEVKRLESF